MVLIIRTYALYGKSKRLLVILLAVGIVEVAVSYHLLEGTTMLKLGYSEGTLISMTVMVPKEPPVKINSEALGCDLPVSLPVWVALLPS